MATNLDERNTDNISSGSGKSNAVLDFLGCSWRATVRLILGLPKRALSFIKRKIKEYRNRPKRTDINRVYVCVGYTTKKRVDEKFNAERRMMIIRRGLLILIFILILFIAVDRFTGMVNLGEIVQIFGIDSFSEVVENDPFADRSTETTNYTTVETTIETSIIANTLETN